MRKLFTVVQAVDATTESLPRILSSTATPWDFLNLAPAAGWFAGRMFGKACFAAGTPIRTPDGSTTIDQLKKGDLVLSRHEDDPDSPIEVKEVEEVFVRESVLLNLVAGGQTIKTTGEHPFYVDGKGWTEARKLQVGDQLVTLDNETITVESVSESSEFETVYNVRVADYHTYFVGTEEWAWSVWAHNATCTWTPNGWELGVHRNPNWTASQLAEAGRKLAAINKAGSQGLLWVNRTIVRGGAQRVYRSQNPAGLRQQADHIVDLQLGGQDILANLRYLDGAVNGSLGSSIKAAIAGLHLATKFGGLYCCDI